MSRYGYALFRCLFDVAFAGLTAHCFWAGPAKAEDWLVYRHGIRASVVTKEKLYLRKISGLREKEQANARI